ncbi:hypothetical protein P43SY_008367 [Pythium insidiosum]|uniref:Uncharacterized protein n=1 Tax=Pythium insidiosum TaxID=114742 RepID=A0AAD5MFQ5_PYTIN|nr:hypothetical protein P43SY_008367 [Pythium insidiosum]
MTQSPKACHTRVASAIIAPPVTLTRELEALHDFLQHQPLHASNDRELTQMMCMSEKELDAKIRELENWNFRLNLDEAHEIQVGNDMDILQGVAYTSPRDR